MELAYWTWYDTMPWPLKFILSFAAGVMLAKLMLWRTH